MSIADYIMLVACLSMLTYMFIIGIWRIICHFKKSCKWKNCPYRRGYRFFYQYNLPEEGCKKFPPTPEELEEEEKMFDRMYKLIDELKEENNRSDH